MAILYLILTDAERLEVASVVTALQTRFPGARVTAENSFEAERQRVAASIVEIAATGKPIRNPKLMLQSVTNKESAMGPGVDVSVPVDPSAVFKGHVWAKHIMLSSDAPCPPAAIELVTAFLRSLKIGNIKVVG